MMVVLLLEAQLQKNPSSSVQQNSGVLNAVGKSLSSREMLRIREKQWKAYHVAGTTGAWVSALNKLGSAIGLCTT